MKLLKYFLILFITSCSAQSSFNYKTVPNEYLKTVTVTQTERKDVLSKLTSGFNVSSILPKNYDKKGNIDYTQIFQNALNQHRQVIIPAGKFKINKQGLTIPNNTQLYFDENAVFQQEANNLIRSEILSIHGVQNVEIYFANILGDRETHIGTEGEWGFGISIQDSKNVTLYKPTVKNCWGDGIFIGSEGKILSENITVKGAFVDNNRRNGISVTSVIGLNLTDILATNSNGTSPMAGVDLEPSNNWEFMQNVNLKNIITFNNKEDGLLVVLVHLKAPDAKKVSINIDGHKDQFSRFGMAFYMDDDKFEGKLPKGILDVKNSDFKNNSGGSFRNYSVSKNNDISVKITNVSEDQNDAGKSQFKKPKNFIVD